MGTSFTSTQQNGCHHQIVCPPLQPSLPDPETCGQTVCHQPGESSPDHHRQQGHRSRSCHRRSRRIRCWNRFSLRISHHRLCQEPQPEAAAVLPRYPGIRPVRGHGTILFDDGVPPPVRLLDPRSSLGRYLCCCCGYVTWVEPSISEHVIKT